MVMKSRGLYCIRSLFVFSIFILGTVGCGTQNLPLAENDGFIGSAPQYVTEENMAALPEGELYITITADDVMLDAVLFDSQTARAFATMLPLTVDLWHPAPNFARAFDLPGRIPQYEEAGWDYELGSLAYWYEGPSIAVIYNASREETVVPVVPIGKITGDASVFFDYGGTIIIELKNDREDE